MFEIAYVRRKIRIDRSAFPDLFAIDAIYEEKRHDFFSPAPLFCTQRMRNGRQKG